MTELLKLNAVERLRCRRACQALGILPPHWATIRYANSRRVKNPEVYDIEIDNVGWPILTAQELTWVRRLCMGEGLRLPLWAFRQKPGRKPKHEGVSLKGNGPLDTVYGL